MNECLGSVIISQLRWLGPPVLDANFSDWNLFLEFSTVDDHYNLRTPPAWFRSSNWAVQDSISHPLSSIPVLINVPVLLQL